MGDGHEAVSRRVLELPMAALGPDVNPSVVLKSLDDLPAVHSVCIIHTHAAPSNAYSSNQDLKQPSMCRPFFFDQARL